ncbi:hypothetical protein QMK92_30040, partial [Klebsiella pneumoniae]
GLLSLGYGYGSDIDHGYLVGQGGHDSGIGIGGSYGSYDGYAAIDLGSSIQKTVTITKGIPIPYPVEKHIPYPVTKHVPYPVKVAVPAPYPVEKPVPYAVRV